MHPDLQSLESFYLEARQAVVSGQATPQQGMAAVAANIRTDAAGRTWQVNPQSPPDHALFLVTGPDGAPRPAHPDEFLAAAPPAPAQPAPPPGYGHAPQPPGYGQAPAEPQPIGYPPAPHPAGYGGPQQAGFDPGGHHQSPSPYPTGGHDPMAQPSYQGPQVSFPAASSLPDTGAEAATRTGVGALAPLVEKANGLVVRAKELPRPLLAAVAAAVLLVLFVFFSTVQGGGSDATPTTTTSPPAEAPAAEPLPDAQLPGEAPAQPGG